jgi:hypothetical protein
VTSDPVEGTRTARRGRRRRTGSCAAARGGMISSASDLVRRGSWRRSLAIHDRSGAPGSLLMRGRCCHRCYQALLIVPARKGYSARLHRRSFAGLQVLCCRRSELLSGPFMTRQGARSCTARCVSSRPGVTHAISRICVQHSDSGAAVNFCFSRSIPELENPPLLCRRATLLSAWRSPLPEYKYAKHRRGAQARGKYQPIPLVARPSNCDPGRRSSG